MRLSGAGENKKGEARGLAMEIKRGVVSVGGHSRLGDDVHAAALLVKLDLAIREGEQRPVATDTDVLAGDELAAALADDDAAGGDEFATKSFYAEALAYAIAAVLYATLTFFMCHMF
jgi:hypothetical protein